MKKRAPPSTNYLELMLMKTDVIQFNVRSICLVLIAIAIVSSSASAQTQGTTKLFHRISLCREIQTWITYLSRIHVLR